MNTLALGSCIGAVSESLHDSIQEYVATNPDNAVSEVMTERLVKMQESTSLSAAAVADIVLTTFILCRTFLTTTVYATVALIFLSTLFLLIVSHLSIYLTTSLPLYLSNYLYISVPVFSLSLAFSPSFFTPLLKVYFLPFISH